LLLKERHQQAAGQAFRTLAEQALLETGCRSWSFGAIPERFDGERQGRPLLGFPALVDEGESVGLRVFQTEAEAVESHRQGSVRLVRLVLARDLRTLRRDLAVNVQAELVYKGLAAHPLAGAGLPAGRDLRDDLLDRVVAEVFIDELPPLRDAAAFAARLAERRAGLGLPAQEIARAVQQGLELLGNVQSRLKAPLPQAALDDIQLQLAWLAPAGFVRSTPSAWLRELPRYLKALQLRLDKLAGDPQRDARLVAEAAPLEARYRARVAAEQASLPPGRDPFRWLLEEFRVSLFAQQLRTRVPVSARRLAEAWAERERQGA
jgi:ATP-dependent helicase HrpA